MDSSILLALLVGAAAGFGIGWLLAGARAGRRITELATTLELERRQAAERVAEVERTIAALSSEALRQNSKTFLQLAEATLKQFHVQAKGDLDLKEKAVENMVKPIREALEKTEQQVRAMEKERKEAYGALSKHLETMTQTQQLLHGETSKLVTALRRPEVRGQWGEMTLKRLAELAGMVEHCDFYQQESVDSDEGRMRPDMIVRMPDGREIVVDVKTPLDAYLSAVEASDDIVRAKHLEHHARKLRERVRELATKAYWNQFKNAPDFVVLFIPGDQFLSAALDVDHALLEDALRQKIILATPTSFVALLRAVAYGWRQESLAENADRIRELGEDLYQRLATFAEHMSKIGSGLETSVGAYNKAVGSLDSKVLPGARKFVEMGVTPKKALETPAPVETVPREVPPVR
jgi:DNA recombination protein RmuC